MTLAGASVILRLIALTTVIPAVARLLLGDRRLAKVPDIASRMRNTLLERRIVMSMEFYRQPSQGLGQILDFFAPLALGEASLLLLPVAIGLAAVRQYVPAAVVFAAPILMPSLLNAAACLLSPAWLVFGIDVDDYARRLTRILASLLATVMYGRDGEGGVVGVYLLIIPARLGHRIGQWFGQWFGWLGVPVLVAIAAIQLVVSLPFFLLDIAVYHFLQFVILLAVLVFSERTWRIALLMAYLCYVASYVLTGIDVLG
jgi:hypothetical protein